MRAARCLGVLLVLATVLVAVVAPIAIAAPSGGGHGDDHGHHSEPWLARFFNFFVFFGILAWLIGSPLKKYFVERKATIKQDLSTAASQLEEAEQRLKEVEERMARLDEESKEIVQRAKEQAAAERELILKNAESEAQRTLGQAESRVEDLEADAVRRLRALAAGLAIDLARDRVVDALNSDDRDRLLDRYLKGLKKAAS